MDRKQLVALMLCNVGLFVMGNMALTLLPVYAVKLGMEESAIGIYLGLAFAAITVGALSSSWFSDRFQRRTLTIIVISLVGIPATFLMGQVSDLALLTLFTLIVWFAAGLATSLVSILTGLHSDPSQRGRIFGLMGSAAAFGSVLGAFASGLIVDRWGYAALFIVTALTWVIPIIATLFIQDSVSTSLPVGQAKPAAVPLPRALWLLLLANTLVSITNFSSLLARPLMMNRLNFDATAISSASAISTLVALPLPLVVGWLSDRTGRKQLLIVGYVFMSVGMLVLISSLELWQFWASASVFTFAGATVGVANALVTDLAPPQVLSTALSRFSATQWLGAIFGYSLTGIVIQGLGLSSTLLIASTLPVLAIIALQLSTRKRVQLAV